MGLIVNAPDDRVSFAKKRLRELNLPVKQVAKAKLAAAAPPKQPTPA